MSDSPILTDGQRGRLLAAMKAAAMRVLKEQRVAAQVEDFTLSRIESDKVVMEITINRSPD